MVAKTFENGDLVWAKLKGFPSWPGEITDPPEKDKLKKAHHYVLFYGSENFAWIPDENIELHNEKLVEKYTKGKKKANYMNAVHIIVTKSKYKTKYLNDSETSSEMSTSNKKIISPNTKVVTKRKEINKSHVQKNDVLENINENKDVFVKGKSCNLNGTLKKKERRKNNYIIRANSKKRELSNKVDILSFQITSAKKQKNDDSSDLSFNSFPENFASDISSGSEVEVDPSILFLPEEYDFCERSRYADLYSTIKQKSDEILTAKILNNDEILITENHGNVEITHTIKNRNNELTHSEKQSENVISNTEKQTNIEITNTTKIDELTKNYELTDTEKQCDNEKNNTEKLSNDEITISKLQKDKCSDLNLDVLPVDIDMPEVIEIYSESGDGIDPFALDEDRPESPTVDMNVEHENIKRKCIDATDKKIGFLGLGRMGQRMVKNLIQSGHSVTVWNRTASRCDNFATALKAQTPADVVNTCDIIFSCLSNPAVAKQVYFMDSGVSCGLQAAAITGEDKDFVELTTLDPTTSKDIYNDVGFYGARYLEAQVSGTKEQANDGTLFLLIAGNRSLFDDCNSCFRAMAETSLFIGPHVGTAATYNIIHNMLSGTIYAALAESLALVEKIGLQKKHFLDTFMHSEDTIVQLDKNNSMGNNNCDINIPLKYVQKSLSSGLELGNSVAQPMHVTAAANEAYKHCKLLKYANHDVSAAYEGARR